MLVSLNYLCTQFYSLKQNRVMTILDNIAEYIAGNPKRPLLIWFHSNSEIDEARRSIASIPGCATCGDNVYEKDGAVIEKKKISDSEGIRFFLFHRYFEQLKAPFLKYAIDLMNKTGLPVVYIANDYSKEEELQLNVAAFDEWDYK